MNFLIIGCGGRESAMLNKLLIEKTNVYAYIPFSNPLFIDKCKDYYVYNIFIIDHLIEYAIDKKINYAIIGSENYLQSGLVDTLQNYNIKCVGPISQLAKIEWSKIYARQFITENNLQIYNPDFIIVNNNTNALKIFNFIQKHNNKVVIKRDGLHSGKGVMVWGDHLFNTEQIINEVQNIINNGENCLLEEKIIGREFSFISITDGKTIYHTKPIMDFKRLDNDNKGPNTGSMGCILDNCDNGLNYINTSEIDVVKYINETIINKLSLINSYKGFLYGSYIQTDNGIKIIEFNSRLGDPEGIVIINSLLSPLNILFKNIADETLGNITLEWDNMAHSCIYVVPQGYPKSKIKDIAFTIDNLDYSYKENILYGGSYIKDDITYINGSRTLAIVDKDIHIKKAHSKVISIAHKIRMENPGLFHHRTDLYKLYTLETSKYSTSGVNVLEANKAVNKIAPLVKSTYNNNVLNSIGSFGGLFSLGDVIKEYYEPVLVTSMDGVGTKSIFTIEHCGIEGFALLGNDIVNHCINDILVQGAKPLYFTDYFASSKLNSDELYYFVKGIAEACKKSNCVIMGGETAEMPNIYESNKHDLVGNIVGVVEKRDIIDGKKNIKLGDIMIGLPSSGAHTNGYSLIRDIYYKHKELFTKDIIDELCRPHRSYLDEIMTLQKMEIKINGLCHITGGGFSDNLARVIPSDLIYSLKLFNFSPLFHTIQKIGKVSNKEMMEVFNCGIGMVIICPKESGQDILSLFSEARIIGQIIKGVIS